MKNVNIKCIGTLFIISTLLSGCGSSETTSDIPVIEVPNTGSQDTSQPATGLVVNEVVASAINDGADWIELYAVSDIADLSIYSLVDDNATREAQALPEIALRAGSYIVIEAIDEADVTADTGYYVSFKLGGDDAVYLYQESDLVSELDWQDGDAEEGYSYGLVVDGEGTPQTMLPSQGSANEAYTDPITLIDTITLHNSALRINEIVAKDANGDEDWIEFYASGNTAVFLGDYTVSDESSEVFALPDVTIAAGEYYKIIATTDEIENTPTLAFKLGASDQVNLFIGDDLIDQLSWNKGDALIGYSYGRFPDGSDGLFTLQPSDNQTNILVNHAPLVINEVVASQNDESSDWFELFNNSANDILLSDYQVIDSSDDIDPVTLPDVTLLAGEYIVIYATDDDPGSAYVPFKLGKNDELSLLKNDETVDYVEWQSSDVSAGYSYGLDNDGSWMLTTLLPTKGAANQLVDIYNQAAVESIYFEIDPALWNDMLINALDEEYHLTAVTYKGVTLDEVAIRTKGNSSLNSVYQSGGERFSFNIDINKYVDGQKLLGMKKFVLNNFFNDPSYMREYIAYDLLAEMGVATPEHSYVNVYVNDELKGLYLLVEFVNTDFLDKHFSHDQGDLYKPDGTGSDLQYISDDFESYTGVELKTNEDSSDNGAFLDLIDAMAYGDASDLIAHDSILRYLAVSVALANLDSYHGSLAHNYYIYEQDNVFSFLPWDLNESFGTFSQGCNGVDIRGLYIDEPTSGRLADRPLIAEVLADPELLNTYHEYLQQLIDGPLSNIEFANRVASIDALISQDVANDPTAFYSFSQYEQNQTSSVSRFYGLTSFMQYRIANMTQQLNGTLASSGTGNGYCSR